jgi:hypothetical protein
VLPAATALVGAAALVVIFVSLSSSYRTCEPVAAARIDCAPIGGAHHNVVPATLGRGGSPAGEFNEQLLAVAQLVGDGGLPPGLLSVMESLSYVAELTVPEPERKGVFDGMGQIYQVRVRCKRRGLTLAPTHGRVHACKT